MWNDDVEISLCRPASTMDYFFRNGEHDECVFVHEGSGTLETTFGNLSYRDGDYVMIPRGDLPLRPEGEQRHRVRVTGLITIPRRYRNEYGQLLEERAVLEPRHPSADRACRRFASRASSSSRCASAAVTDVRPRLPPVRRRRLGRLPLPVDVLGARLRADHRAHPPAAALAPDVPGPELRHLLVLPAQARLRPGGGPIPYHHSNLQSEEMIYYVSGNFGSRKGSRWARSRCIPRVCREPQPGLAEKSLGVAETTRLAVMCDTFRPLRLSTFAAELDDGRYAYSWYEPAEGDPGLAG